MRAEHRYRQAAHYYVSLRFTDNGEGYRYDASYDEYKSLQPGDSCIVTLRDGIWGYPVIQNLQPVEKSVSPHRNIKSLPDLLNEGKRIDYKALSGSENSRRYGQPLYVKQATAEDMKREFRVGLLNIASFEVKRVVMTAKVTAQAEGNIFHKTTADAIIAYI